MGRTTATGEGRNERLSDPTLGCAIQQPHLNKQLLYGWERIPGGRLVCGGVSVMSKITVRLQDDTRRLVDANAEALKLSVSEYIRRLVEANIATVPDVSLPPLLRDIVDNDVAHGLFRDEADCIVYYIREGMKADGRLTAPMREADE